MCAYASLQRAYGVLTVWLHCAYSALTFRLLKGVTACYAIMESVMHNGRPSRLRQRERGTFHRAALEFIHVLSGFGNSTISLEIGPTHYMQPPLGVRVRPRRLAHPRRRLPDTSHPARRQQAPKETIPGDAQRGEPAACIRQRISTIASARGSASAHFISGSCPLASSLSVRIASHASRSSSCTARALILEQLSGWY